MHLLSARLFNAWHGNPGLKLSSFMPVVRHLQFSIILGNWACTVPQSFPSYGPVVAHLSKVLKGTLSDLNVTMQAALELLDVYFLALHH